MKRIELSQGRVALVDDEDFEWLSQWKWCYARNKEATTGYALRTDSCRMHIAIAERSGLWKFGYEIDHVNGCGCDNRKENLRVATRRENGCNQKKRSDNSSGKTGVSWDSSRHRWRVQIMVNYRAKTIGRFKNLEDAKRVRMIAEAEYFGKFQHDPTNVCPLGYTGECSDCVARIS